LLGWETATTHDHVVLVYRIREDVHQAALDLRSLELELLSGNGERRHVSNCIL
jgi:hypothetical protein